MWWLRVDPADLESAKQAEVEADKIQQAARADGRWARAALDRDGFADALTLIMRGGAS